MVLQGRHLDVVCGVMFEGTSVSQTPVTLYFKNEDNRMVPVAQGFHPEEFQPLASGMAAPNVAHVVGTRHDYTAALFLLSTDFCTTESAGNQDSNSNV